MHKTQHYKLTLSKVSITVQQSRYYKLISHFEGYRTKSVAINADGTS